MHVSRIVFHRYKLNSEIKEFSCQCVIHVVAKFVLEYPNNKFAHCISGLFESMIVIPLLIHLLVLVILAQAFLSLLQFYISLLQFYISMLPSFGLFREWNECFKISSSTPSSFWSNLLP